MKNLASFLLSVMLICFSACSNNDDLVEVRQQVTPLKNLVRSTTFNYQGKNYTSEFNYTNDSSIVYIDKEVQKTAEKLDQNPILVTFFNAGIITYYDNESEFDKTLNINTKATRASRLAAEATFYKDTNYNGAELKIGAGNYPDLNSYSFDNCISSFKASTTNPGFPTSPVAVRLYADKNYGGRMYSFLIIDGPGWNNTYTKDVPNLGDYNLNDNVSSIKIGY